MCDISHRNRNQIQAHLPPPEPASQEPAIGDVLALPADAGARLQLTGTDQPAGAGRRSLTGSAAAEPDDHRPKAMDVPGLSRGCLARPAAPADAIAAVFSRSATWQRAGRGNRPGSGRRVAGAGAGAWCAFPTGEPGENESVPATAPHPGRGAIGQWRRRVSIGEVLAAARRQAGLTITQVSQRTRIRETIIRGIEEDDFAACGGDFYARGHIRAIARAAGVDGEPLVRQYDSSHRTP